MRRTPPLQTLRGFTLVELVAVMAVIAIAALVVLPTLAPSQPYALDLAAQDFADAIRTARSEALRTATPHGVHIEGGPSRIRVFRGAPIPVYDVPHPLTKRPYEINLDTSSSGVGVTHAATWSAVCGQPELIGFDSNGTPRCGNPWPVLLEAGTITLNLAGHTRIVVVDGETGRVTVQ